MQAVLESFRQGYIIIVIALYLLQEEGCSGMVMGQIKGALCRVGIAWFVRIHQRNHNQIKLASHEYRLVAAL